MAPSNCAVFLRSGARCGRPYRWAPGPPVTRKAKRDLRGDRRWGQAICERKRIPGTDGRTHYRRIKKLKTKMKRLFVVIRSHGADWRASHSMEDQKDWQAHASFMNT